MTRFARAEGSKSSNKRTYEEATPWSEMKKDIKKSTQTKRSKKDKSKSEEAFSATPVGEVKKKLKENKNSDKKKKRKGSESKGKNQTKESSREYRGKDPHCIVENGIKYRLFNGKKKPWYDIPFEENDRMTLYKKLFVKHEDVPKLENFRKSLKEQNLDEATINAKMFQRERKMHSKLRVELVREQIAENKGSSDGKLKQFTDWKENFKNSDLATKFDGYWVRKSNSENMEELSRSVKEKIIQARTNGNTGNTLTAQEELAYHRAMKKEKRKESKLLMNDIYNERKKKNSTPRKKSSFGPSKPGKYLGIEFNKDGLEKFDGFYVSKEAAERLRKLRDTLISRGCSEEEVASTIKSERRREERELKNKNKVCCYRCRAVGHTISSCPENEAEGLVGVVVCFKCGSAEHLARNCPANKKGFDHATCFICKETGHISRECPDNPKGLYPNGGCCSSCGSVEHLKRDCPDLQKSNEKGVMKVASFKHGQAIDALDEEPTSVGQVYQSKMPKKPTIIFDD